MGNSIRARVERVVVHALVYSHAPEHDAGMIAVLQNHLAQVLASLLLPPFVPDMLPAGQLREHQQAKPVALVDEILALRIVRGAHSIAAQLLLQYPRVLALKRFGRGVAHVRIALVPVQAAHEHAAAVEIKAVRAKFDVTEAEFHALRVARLQRDLAGVELRAVDIPFLRAGHVYHADVSCAVRLRHQALPVEDAQLRVPVCAGNGVADAGGAALGTDEDVLYVVFVPDIQPRLAVKPRIGQVIYHEAKRRQCGILAAVELHGDEVLRAVLHKLRYLDSERRVAAAVLRGERAVDVYPRVVRRAVKLQEQSLAAAALGDEQALAVAADSFIILRPAVVQRQLMRVMRQAYALRAAVAVRKAVSPFGCEFPVIAKAYHIEPPVIPL